MYTEDSLFLSNQIFVAPDGRDSASGQKDAPLQTLEAALRLMQSYSPSMFVAMFQKATDPDARQVIHDELVLQTAQSEVLIRTSSSAAVCIR